MTGRRIMEKEIRRHFSKIGFAYLAGSIVIYAVQFLAAMVGKKFVPAVMADANGSFIVLMLTMYGISMPFMGWMVRRVPAQKIEGRKMTAGQWIIAFLMCYGLMLSLIHIFSSFAHREALPSCPAMGEFSCKHEIRLQVHSRRLRNSLPRHSQKRIFDARRAGCAIASFAPVSYTHLGHAEGEGFGRAVQSF